MKSVLITGGAGFIGSHLSESLLTDGYRVSVIDNFDPYYDRQHKERNLSILKAFPDFRFVEADIRNAEALEVLFAADPPEIIVHLAAKAGVRPSVKKPLVFQEVNVTGTQNLLETARKFGVKQFVFASSSSVYGVNPNVPWRESDYVLQPISPYASTKVSGELMGHVYSKLYGIRFLAVRLFTVYGPRQRPDLAIHKFIGRMLRGEKIPVFGDGSTRRDYTFVGDIVAGIRLAMQYDQSPYEIFNLGNNHTVSLAEMIETLEKTLGIKAGIDRQPMQPGDVPQTYADLEKSRRLLGYAPKTSFPEGVAAFAEWYKGLPVT